MAKTKPVTKPKKPAAGGELATARAAVEAGKEGPALVALLAAWRRMRHPDVAALVERLGKRVGRGRKLSGLEPPKGRSYGIHQLDDNWVKIAERRDPADVDPLVATAFEGDFKRRFVTLIGGEVDPRIATALVACLQGQHGSEVASWRRLFVGLAKCGDPRVLARLPAIYKHWKPSKLLGPAFEKSITQPLDKLIPAARTALGAIAIVKPTAAERADLAAITAHLDAGDRDVPARDPATEAALLAAVYAAPADDAPRTVYADWLIERGDPRGEHMPPAHRQLSRA